MRGADILVRALEKVNANHLFALSGNQIMSIFDASIDSSINLIHVRHEAAAVHMADAWGRLTNEPGIALVTAGPGFANTLSALYVANMAESPLILLSGDSPISLRGRGPFQEMKQTTMSEPVTKASWTVTNLSSIECDLIKAINLSKAGRPGPVHLSLPVDILETIINTDGIISNFVSVSNHQSGLKNNDLKAILEALKKAERPLILVGPAMTRSDGKQAVTEFQETTGIPVVSMESPRGIKDPSLGAFHEIIEQVDLVVLLGRKLDFGLNLGAALPEACKIIMVDADEHSIEQAQISLNPESRFILAKVANPVSVTQNLARFTMGEELADPTWSAEVTSALNYRPIEWEKIKSEPNSPLHPLEVSQAVEEILGQAQAPIFISDGGEFGQWSQACVSITPRLINGPAGSIGSSIPFALAAQLLFCESTVISMLGDGTAGFHLSEFDTAVRYKLPFIAVIGNDSAWNAEYQIQLREYGKERLSNCELLPTRYDQVAKALGGHGEYVTSITELKPAFQRALNSGLPSCINVSIGRYAAPNVNRRG